MKKTSPLIFLLLFVNTVYCQSDKTYASNQLIAKLNESIAVSVVENQLIFKDVSMLKFLNELGVDHISKLAKGNHHRKIQDEILLIEFINDIDVFAVIAKIASKEIFNYVEPNFVGSISGTCVNSPNDTYFENRQWAMVNDGTFEAGSVFDGDIDMDSAWVLTTGDSTVVVSILDSGLKLDHEDLEGRIWKNNLELLANATDDDANGYIDDINGYDFVNFDGDPTDDNGHGTNVTGIIGANGDNNKGYAGVDWNCKLLTCKVIDNNGSGLYSAWISGIYYSVDNGADVINMSLSGGSFSQGMQDAINFAYSNDVPVVVSMANGDTNLLRYPAAMNNVIAVGATNSKNERTSPFTWGGGSNYGNHIDIMAPGNKIFGLNYLSSTNYNTYWSGTSQSTPYVTGVVALLKGVDKTYTSDFIKNLLIQNAVDKLGKPTEDTPGWDQYHGHGLMNAYQTLSQVINPLNESSSVDLQISCGSYTWLDNVIYTESNDSAFVVLVNAVGCDSTVYLDLTILEVDTSITLIDSSSLASNAIGVTYQWLDCNLNNSPIIGANSKNFTTTYNSTFAVAIAENACIDTSACYSLKVEIESTDINDLNAFRKVRIYPSTTTGMVNFVLEDLEDVRIKIFNTQGQIVFMEEHIYDQLKKINLESAPGIYFIEVSNSKGKEVFKLIKN